MCLEGSDGFVTSTAAPIASGWSDPVGRAGLAPAGKTLPYHGALSIIYKYIFFYYRSSATQRVPPENWGDEIETRPQWVSLSSTVIQNPLDGGP